MPQAELELTALAVACTTALLWGLASAKRRLDLSLAKHP